MSTATFFPSNLCPPPKEQHPSGSGVLRGRYFPRHPGWEQLGYACTYSPPMSTPEMGRRALREWCRKIYSYPYRFYVTETESRGSAAHLAALGCSREALPKSQYPQSRSMMFRWFSGRTRCSPASPAFTRDVKPKWVFPWAILLEAIDILTIMIITGVGKMRWGLSLREEHHLIQNKTRSR